ncbi:MAG: class I SAM-dependent methyltransferase [Sandaracinaceae bacterium]
MSSSSKRDAARGQYRTTVTDWSRVAPYIRYRYERARERLPATGTVYELGCGIGVGLAYLARTRPDLRFVGFEMSEGAVEYGREQFAQVKNLRLEVIGDVGALAHQLDPGAFLVALEVLEHLDDETLTKFKVDVMSRVDEVVFSFPYNQQNIEGTDHLQSFDIYDIFEIFPGFETIFMRRGSIKFIGHWRRAPRAYLREALGIGGEAKSVQAIANVEARRDPPSTTRRSGARRGWLARLGRRLVDA